MHFYLFYPDFVLFLTQKKQAKKLKFLFRFFKKSSTLKNIDFFNQVFSYKPIFDKFNLLLFGNSVKSL